ncbi:MAG TPA: ABC transporter ATP-binding protein [Acidobacteriota bacterium]|nr:ABC transporter ATP-binding protein [Acidobacteriota bacterium]
MKSAVEVRQLSKKYKRYPGPRGLLREWLTGRSSHQAHWALREISFSIQEGEAFGVCGDNGAGKSTLLKILTGTAFPTSGVVEVSGRVSALLELGAGFHPEFSGRENIYFNGSLMGMRRREIAEREEEIIEFSELSPFIDHPVRTYSSGMYVRLGFAVATGFDPDILIIDEALAVGDQRFQKKCTDRILDFRRSGKTIVFCSHNLYQIRTLCERALWLHEGEAAACGEAADVVDRYQDYCRASEASLESVLEPHPSNGQVCWIDSVQVLNDRGRPQDEFRSGDTVVVQIEATFQNAFRGVPAIAVSLERNDGIFVYCVSSGMDAASLQQIDSERFRARLAFPELPLLSGLFHVSAMTTDQDSMQAYDHAAKAASFRIVGHQPDLGLIHVKHRWE